MAKKDNPGAVMGDAELADWLASLQYVMEHEGRGRAGRLLGRLYEEAVRRGVELPLSGVFWPRTPQVNTIRLEDEPPYPGDRDIERRIKSIIRWNAMAMVVQANRRDHSIGGHISTYGSAATLWEVGFNHFWRARSEEFPGDIVFFQGHASPGVYARAFLEGRISERQMHNFRRELFAKNEGGGLSSYPHPWLMSDFWEVPTVSMGLGPLMGIYQARFHHYLVDRSLMKPSDAKVWVMLGDGEMDEPESLGGIHLASRENLDNLIFVVNCNLHRLDGPVRGNSSIVQELEGMFRGAGWRVIKVLWGGDWDPLLRSPAGELLAKRMGEVPDGEYQKYVVAGGAYIREHFFGKYPELAELVKDLPDEKLARLRRGGHDPQKVYAAYKAAMATHDRPTAILAMTIKGYGQGEAGEGRNISHKQKELNEEELLYFRRSFNVPVPVEQIAEAPFCRPEQNGPEGRYLHERRLRLGGYLPSRRTDFEKLTTPALDDYRDMLEGSGEKTMSTTMAAVRLLGRLLRDEQIGRRIVPIVPDEARTFGMESLFRQCGIYSHHGQSYTPVDADKMLYYREITDGQILEEGITEAGCASSFIAAGSAHATRGVSMIPMFLFYSMFGFQRVGDLLWAAGDSRCKGFLLGGTSGRTTLAGEGLQHQDGHSQLIAGAYPTVRPYDPAFAYEIAVIMLDGLKRMYTDGRDEMYYLTIGNENHAMPAMPQGVAEGICKGLYLFNTRNGKPGGAWVELMASGSMVFEAMRAQGMLAEQFGVSSNLWSATSWCLLARDGMAAERWSRLHPAEPPRQPYIRQAMGELRGPIVAASDYVRAVAEQVRPYVGGEMTVLGTDGFGRSDSREALRRFFEVNAEHIVIAALDQLSRRGQFDRDRLPQIIKDFGVDVDAPPPWTV